MDKIYEINKFINFNNWSVFVFVMMKIQTELGTSLVDLPRSVESHLRNAGFVEEVIDEIVKALEWKEEFDNYKRELGIITS